MSIQLRDKLVRDLNQTDAGNLLVHAHTISPERRKALLLVRGPARAYFSDEEQHEVRAWIDNEDFLPQDSPIDHPKRPTHWCDHHGHVESCACDAKKQKRENLRNELAEAQAHVARLQAEIRQLKSAIAEECLTVAIDRR